MKHVCVFCGSRPGADPAFIAGAVALGHALVANGVGLVYGGGARGMMGTVADAVLRSGGEVIGVVPHGLFRDEDVHRGLTEVIEVDSLAERKAVMAQRSDGFIVLPGGVGTLDELFEVWAWLQLGLQLQPCGILNVAGYFDGLLSFLDQTVRAGFVEVGHRGLVAVESEPEALLRRLINRRDG